jgi:uncharacterized damage-inducible protein DinB
MTTNTRSLAFVLDGWNGYNTSLAKAIAPLTPEQLAYRSADFRSVGELARHIALGRLNWFVRMDAPGSAELAKQIPEWVEDGEGNRHIVEEKVVGAVDAAELVRWLNLSWDMVQTTLSKWTVDDLAEAYLHKFRGTVYAVTRQWTTFRMLAHDIHHGGQLSILLGEQGIEAFELIGLGGHIVEPPVAPSF